MDTFYCNKSIIIHPYIRNKHFSTHFPKSTNKVSHGHIRKHVLDLYSILFISPNIASRSSWNAAHLSTKCLTSSTSR